MNTQIYIIRHADKLMGMIDEYKSLDKPRLRDEKRVLSVKGEYQSHLLAQMNILENINVIYCSHFSRTKATAKYLAQKLNLNLKVDERLGEQKYGDFREKKFEHYLDNKYHDFHYFAPNGESMLATKERITKAFEEIFETNRGKEIAIFGHEIAFNCLLLNFCEVGYNLDDKLILTYKNLSIPTKWHSPDGYKLTFNGDTLMNIEKIDMPFMDE